MPYNFLQYDGPPRGPGVLGEDAGPVKLRQSNLEKLDQRVFDVLVVGGGINGAVSAAALSAQGASVALIDRGDFAGFTSQESSNLVWGGIKYLEGLELGLVNKLCASRNRLLKTYPSTVREIRFFVTLQRGFRWPRWFLWLGTWLYWLMGRLFTAPPRLLSVRDVRQQEPVVRADDITGGVEYSDAFLLDNDARFVFGFVRRAIDHGAIVANYVESVGARREDGLWVCETRDLVSGARREVRARALINACGPMVDAHNDRTQVATRHKHLFSRGVHLIVRRLTDSRRVLTFFADDGRMFFAIPMGTRTCIGTTDTRQERLPPVVTEEDRQFVLANINARLGLAEPLTEADIVAERCGVRPLVVERGQSGEGDDWTSLSRKHVVEVDMERAHVSVFGGKLTDCLNVGEEVSRSVQRLGIALPHLGYRWYGEPHPRVRQEFFHQAQLMELDALTSPLSSEPLSTRLWRRYGRNALDLLEDIREDPRMGEVLIEGAEYIRCELHHAERREMVTKLEDFLRRRSKIALVTRHEVMQDAPGLFEACRILFGERAAERYREYFGAPPSEDVVRRSEPPAAQAGLHD